MQIALTIGIFLLTLFFMLRPPRGMNEAWATVGGGLLMLLFGRVTLAQAVAITRQGADILAFLFTLMLLAALLDGSGFFEWAARRAARAASGSAVALYRNMFLLGALITILLSLDTTAVILTPIALAFVARLKLPPRPFLISCAFVANAGSLLLPVSNLTNLLFVRAFGWSFSSFALRMALPQGAALLVGYGAMRWLYRKELPLQFDAGELPEPKSALPDIFYFRGAVVVLIAVLVGYFSGRLLLRFAAANSALSSRALRLRGLSALAALRKQLKPKELARGISWSLFPFVVGLFVVVRGVENLGLAAVLARGLQAAGTHPLAQILAAAFSVGLGSNAVNNIPAALLSISALQMGRADAPTQYGALLGCNIGPNLTVAGSLATMLVLTTARRKGMDIRAVDFLKAGVVAMPLALAAAGLALWLSFSLWR